MAEIVVGYDGSECGKAALGRACALAKGLGDRVLIVYGYAPGGPGGGEIPSHREAVEELAKQATAEGAAQASTAGVEHEVRLKPVAPVEALIETAEESAARMIVVGTYGETPLKGVILGSTPYKLLHQSMVPVLVVPLPR